MAENSILGKQGLTLYDISLKRKLSEVLSNAGKIDELFPDEEEPFPNNDPFPPMTSNTTPYNEVDYYTCNYRGDGYVLTHMEDGYKFFDQDMYVYPNCDGLCYHYDEDYYIKYTFCKAVTVNKIKLFFDSLWSDEWGFKIQGSNDGSNFTDLTNWKKLVRDTDYWYYIDIDNPQNYKSYRITWKKVQSNTELGNWITDNAYYYTGTLREVQLIIPE